VEVVDGAVDMKIRKCCEVAEVAHAAPNRVEMDAPQLSEACDVVQAWPESVTKAEVREACSHVVFPDSA
jgi:hypothetical protein